MSERKTKNAPTNGIKETEGDSENSPKKFSKLKLLQVLGLLSRKYNYESNEFERSWFLRLVSLVTLLSKLLYLCPFLISCFYEKTDVAQLYIGRRVIEYQ